MAKDAGTKTDKPSDQEGSGTPAKEELETQQAAQAAAESDAQAAAEAPEETPEPSEPGVPQADGTAAAKTGIDKAGAEAGLVGADPEVAKSSAATSSGDSIPDEKPKPKRSRKPKAAKPAEEEAPKPTPAPAPAARRDGDTVVIVRAQAKFVRTSARKARLVADHVRGKSVQEARSILAFSPRSVAEDWRKVLESAVANAEHNHDLVGDDLRVLNATADEGPTLKRFRPRAMGRATKIRKRTSHLTITLTPKD
jgi:ribosomal protein L22